MRKSNVGESNIKRSFGDNDERERKEETMPQIQRRGRNTDSTSNNK